MPTKRHLSTFVTVFGLLLIGFVQKTQAETKIECVKKNYIDDTVGVVTIPPINGSKTGRINLDGFLTIEACLIPTDIGKLISYYDQDKRQFVPYNPNPNGELFRWDDSNMRILTDKETGKEYYGIAIGNRVIFSSE